MSDSSERQTQRICDELENLLQEWIDDTGYERIFGGADRCLQCRATKGQPHAAECVVGKSEALLRHLEV
mgnify:CR=1 FL=1